MDAEEFAAARENYLDALWEDYIITGEEDKSRPHGRSDPFDDLQFGFVVELLQADGASLDAAISEKAAEFGLTESGAREKYRRGRRIGLIRRDSAYPA